MGVFGERSLEEAIGSHNDAVISKLNNVHKDLLQGFQEVIAVEKMRFDMDSDLRNLSAAVADMEKRSGAYSHISEFCIVTGIAITSLGVAVDSPLSLVLGFAMMVLAVVFMLVEVRSRKRDQTAVSRLTAEVVVRWTARGSVSAASHPELPERTAEFSSG